MASSAPKTASQRTADYRARKKAAGFRLVQRWAYDRSNPEVEAMILRHCEAIGKLQTEAEDQAYLDFITDWSEV